MTDIQPERNLAPLSLPLYEMQGLDQCHPTSFVSVFIGFLAWQTGKDYALTFPTRTIVIPPWYSPGMYIYPVHNCRILIRETYQPLADIHYVFNVAKELNRQGAREVFYMDYDAATNQPELLTL